MASCRSRLRDRFRSDGQLEPRTVKPRMVAYPFYPSWAAVGEQVTAGYANFFFSLYRTRLSVIAPQRDRVALAREHLLAVHSLLPLRRPRWWSEFQTGQARLPFRPPPSLRHPTSCGSPPPDLLAPCCNRERAGVSPIIGTEGCLPGALKAEMNALENCACVRGDVILI